jgi:predicted ABC-class ATPase
MVRELPLGFVFRLLERLGIDDPLPDLVYGNDGEELMAKLDELGLVAYVGVMPHLRKIPKEADLLPGSWPYAFGHSLYLEIELRGA